MTKEQARTVKSGDWVSFQEEGSVLIEIRKVCSGVMEGELSDEDAKKWCTRESVIEYHDLYEIHMRMNPLTGLPTSYDKHIPDRISHLDQSKHELLLLC